MKLWLARHAQPHIPAGVCYGRLDMPAEDDATLTCAQALAAILPQDTTVVSSPLRRCVQLAHALQGLRADLPFRTDPRLQEMHFGNWEGRAWSDIAEAEISAWTAHFGPHVVGSTGESVNAFMQRVGTVFDELDMAKDSNVLWITHAGVIRAATLLSQDVRELEQAKQWPKEAPAFGQWCTLEI